MRPRFARRAAALVLALVLATGAYGQSMRRTPFGGSESSGSATIGSGMGGLSLDGHSYMLAQPQSGMAILPSDNSIDENEYMIGAGDVFFITAVESPSIRYTAAVDQNGKAYIQNIGLINIGKVSYAEAKKAIAQYISGKLKNQSEIYVSLVQTKKATVSFTGQIGAPGSYEHPGSMRLLDAIKAANGGALPHASDANLRRVQGVGSGDSVVYYDLLAYLYKGDASQNPYIYPGDRIRISPTTDKVFISGAVRSPPAGYYPLKKNETIGEFLSMFTLDNTADLDGIIVYRSADNTKKTISGTKDDYLLNDLDAITVPVKRDHSGTYTVSVSGEIASPGNYPIVENVTTARQLIDMAGGVKASGFMDQAVVIRPLRTLPERFNAGAPQMSVVRPERGSAVAVASASRDYAVIRLILYNADNVILEPQDQIIIPKKDSFVYISGSVRSPGAYLFLPGKDSRYYVTQAGGFSSNADKSNVQVFLKYGDAVQGIEPRCVEPGSVIVVPASVQNKFLTQVLLPIISTLATTIGVGLAIYNSR